MSIRLFAALLVALLSLTLLAGCERPAEAALSAQPPVGGTVATDQTRQPATVELLTPEQAQEIALQHADTTKEAVTGLKTVFDGDDGVPEYDVEFFCNGTEYDYEIHAQTGQILHTEKEVKPASAPQQPAAPEKLTREQAQQIALQHAGLTKDQVSRLKVEYDVDDGVPEYDVEFFYNGWEYDYEIHAQTGKVLSWDKEHDD